MILEIFGILAVLVFVIGDFPYLADTIKGKTQPHRVNWGIAFLINALNLANQIASGAAASVWSFWAGTIVVGAIFLASIKNGVGGHTKLDIFSILVSLFGVILWLSFDSPLFSALANSFVSSVAIIPTYIKAYKDPDSETRIAWLFGAISSLFTALAVGELNLALLLIPITGIFRQGYLVYLLYIRPR